MQFLDCFCLHFEGLAVEDDLSGIIYSGDAVQNGGYGESNNEAVTGNQTVSDCTIETGNDAQSKYFHKTFVITLPNPCCLVFNYPAYWLSEKHQQI